MDPDEAIGTLMRAAGGRLLRLAYQLCHERSAAEDLVQEAADRDVGDDVGERDRMWVALGTLAARQRAVLVLRYYLDLPDREIAVVLGCREATVRSIAARALTLCERTQ